MSNPCRDQSPEPSTSHATPPDTSRDYAVTGEGSHPGTSKVFRGVWRFTAAGVHAARTKAVVPPPRPRVPSYVPLGTRTRQDNERNLGAPRRGRHADHRRQGEGAEPGVCRHARTGERSITRARQVLFSGRSQRVFRCVFFACIAPLLGLPGRFVPVPEWGLSESPLNLPVGESQAKTGEGCRRFEAGPPYVEQGKDTYLLSPPISSLSPP